MNLSSFMHNWNLILLIVVIACAVAAGYCDLRRRNIRLFQKKNISALVYLDILSTAAPLTMAGWVVFGELRDAGGRIALILSALFFGGAIFVYLWSEGRRAKQFQRPDGIVWGEFLILAGGARVALRLIGGEHPAFDMFSIAGLIAGGLVIAWVLPRFLKKREEHLIIERVAQQGEVQQSEYTPPTAECPHPERWTMMDSMTAEVEVLEFLKQIVLTLKPELIVETGTFIAASTIKMAEALRANGLGRIITCEFDPVVYAKAKERIEASGVREWIEIRNQSSLEMEISGTIDLFFSDSDLTIREDEIRRFLPQMDGNGLILMHDTSSHYKVAREAAFRLEHEGLISMVLLPTPRGLMIGQKRAGRK